MSWLDTIRNRITNWIMAGFDDAQRSRQKEIATVRDYVDGEQPEQIKSGRYNDNIIVNFCGLVVDRSVYMLLGKGISFTFPEDRDAERDYIKALWRLNKSKILLYDALHFATTGGTGFLQILPEGITGSDEKRFPRLVSVDPLYVTMETLPHDMDIVIRYSIQYNYSRAGEEVSRKQVHEQTEGGNTWEIIESEASRGTGWRWQEVSRVVWPYPFPALIHWKNLPNPGKATGKPDITPDIIRLQNKINLVASNTAKIIRQYAHPRVWGKMLGQSNEVDWGPGEIPNYNNPEAEINQLEQLSDLAGSASFLMYLQKSLMDIAQSADLPSLGARLGQVTNFALRILLFDATARLDTKRVLFSDMLEELNRRLLVIANMDSTEPGAVLWSDPLPESETEETAALEADLRMEIVSKQTAARRRGYDWDEEQKRMRQEQQYDYEETPEL